MSRTVERIIDLIALVMLLSFTFLFRDSQPALAGLVVGAAIQFWMAKNASSPESQAHKETVAAIEATAAQVTSAATAAAEVLKTAERAVKDKENKVIEELKAKESLESSTRGNLP